VAVEVRRRFWQLVRAGSSVVDAAVSVGVAGGTGQRWFLEAGGVIPSIVEQPSGRALSLAEREEIACRRAAGAGIRAIARELGRSESTVSRELARNTTRRAYRASTAQAAADRRGRRPKPSVLATNLPLRAEVTRRLRLSHSPEQISACLRVDFPDRPEMWVSTETIYQSIYVQGRGGLKRDLARHLRTGRALRKPRRRPAERRGRIPNMVNIAERPAEADDRAVPGHWEGDLITGESNKSAIGTLVERASGFVILLHLPGDHGALAVQHAMITAMAALPDTLRRTLTWDQGAEMTNHAQIAAATDLDIYFCDPHSPWQRGSNENINGLLRQYFPKGSDLTVHGPGILEHVAAELNNRPRKRHNWATPARVLDALLSQPTDPTGVASTA
jgi:IS30 family transposase